MPDHHPYDIQLYQDSSLDLAYKPNRATRRQMEFGHQAITKETFNRLVLVAREDTKRELGATRIYNSAPLGDGLMSCLDRLRQHEARSAIEDPMIAEEYAMVRRAVLHVGIEQITRYGTGR
jgi:hypothetical protein